MKPNHLLIAVSCLFCLALPLLSGCGNKNEEGPPRMVEIPIGDSNTFVITNVRDDLNETFSLRMYVAVQQGELRHFERRLAQCENEVIDRITAVLYASSRAERTEMGLTTIKEKVKWATNEVLGTPWVQQVFFTEITLVVE